MKRLSFIAPWIALFALSANAFAFDCGKYRSEVQKAVAAEDNAAAISQIKMLGGESDEGRLECLYQIGFRFAINKELNDAVIEQFHKDPEASVKYLTSLVTDEYDGKGGKNIINRRFISTLLIGLETEPAVALAASMLEDVDDRVQTVAINVLRASKQRAAIKPLIDMLERMTNDRQTRTIVYFELRDALYELTLEDHELLDDWKRWWQLNQNSFDPKNIDGGDGKTKRARPKRDDDEPEVGDMPIQSKHLVFVLDTSGSMRYVENTKIPGLASGDGSDGGGASGGGQMSAEDRRLADFWTRMEMAKRELYKVVYLLDGRAKFNLVNFDTSVRPFKKKSVQASGGNKKKALKWIIGLRAKQDGATNTLDALQEAFTSDPNTNTIYFLSDGQPSKDGKNTDAFKPILDKIFELNRFRRIKIHTFGFDPRAYGVAQKNPNLVAANEFLKKLSDSTGGQFTEIGCDPKSASPDKPFGPKGLDGRGGQGGMEY